MGKLWVRIISIAMVVTVGSGPLSAQGPSGSVAEQTEESNKVPGAISGDTEGAVSAPSERRRNAAVRLLGDFAEDQKELWTSPGKLRFSDATWLVPISGLSTALLVTDSDAARNISSDGSHYKNVSRAGLAALLGSAGGMWLLGRLQHNAHWSETGLLAGEAAVHSLAMTEVLKYSFRRERPFQNNARGSFFQEGGRSFPSANSAVAWSVAGVMAHEYPGPLPKLFAYGMASLVSYSRVQAKQHFPFDVAVGALLGELAAHQVYKKHHDRELGGDTWRSPATFFFDEGESKAGFIGSPYVPLDSWIYPVLDRLVAMGFINSSFSGSRPWTRLACAQIVVEAQDHVDDMGSVAGDLVRELQQEFQPELGGGAERGQSTARLESVYFRNDYISGKPLTDGYHFAQTRINDFGRPFSEGWNTITGFSVYATSGPWSGYVRGEAQTAPGIPALPLPARQFATVADGLGTIFPDSPTPSVQQFRLLDAYVGITAWNWQVSFGRQSLSWGPGDGGALLFSNNAAPIDMFRINRVTPLGIPLVSRFLGPLRAEFFFGQLSGHHFVGKPDFSTDGSFQETLDPQPFIHGQRFSFKPTPNFEFGFSRTTILGGPGVPLTFGNFANSLFGVLHNAPPGSRDDPGDRRSGMDWSYRLPGLRKWATFYGDAYAEDQPSPIAYWDRSAIRAGLFLSHLPKLPRLDLRMEGVYTDLTAGGALGFGYFYANSRFRDGYTNDGNLIGSWIGRDGQGAQVWSNYWFNAKNRVQFSFRHQKVSQQFPPGGGTVTDAGVRGDYWFRQGVGITAGIQYERWLFPVIQTGPERNWTGSVQIQFQPQKFLRYPFHRETGEAGLGDRN